MQSRIHRCAPLAYLLLASIYLLYLPYAEFVLDDWFVLARYQTAREAGPRALAGTGFAILQNKFHNQFRFQFLSYESAYWLFLAVGYSPKIVFLLFLALHAAGAMALRSVVERLGLGSGPAFLAGALFLLLPTTHGVIFWPHNCCYYLWSTFWFLLYLRMLIPSLQSGQLGWKEARPQIAFLLLALFSGDPVFALLLAGAPLMAWFLRSRAGIRATLLAWGTVGIAAPLYALLINRAPIVQQGLGLRFRWTWGTPWRTLSDIFDTCQRLTGFGDRAFYQLRWTVPGVAAAAVATIVAIVFAAKANGGGRTARVVLLAAGLWLAAYGPTWFLGAHEFRYDYVPSAYLALGLAAVAFAWRPVCVPAAAILLGWCALAAVADIDQCWTVQSRNLRAIGDGLRTLHPVERGELIILSNAPEFVGTAPHFVLLAGWASTPYAEHVTGVRGIEAACEIVDEEGRLRVFHRDHMRDLNPAELAKTVVLVQEGGPRFSRRRLLADPVRPGVYKLYALKGYDGPPVPASELSRAQIALAESEIYFARPFSHRHAH